MNNSIGEFAVNNEQGITIDFKALVMELMDKILIIIFCGIFCGLLTYLGCSTIIPLNYESTTKIYIMPQETEGQSAYVDLEVGSLLTTDYIEVVQGRDVIEQVISHYNLDLTYESFLQKVTVNNPTDTRIIEVSVRDKDPYLARNLAIYLRDVATTAIETGMGIDGITMWEEANLPLKPKITAAVYAVILACIALFLTALIVIIRYLVIDKIVSADDIEKRLNLVVLGAIAYEGKRQQKRGNRHGKKKS